MPADAEQSEDALRRDQKVHVRRPAARNLRGLEQLRQVRVAPLLNLLTTQHLLHGGDAQGALVQLHDSAADQRTPDIQLTYTAFSPRS